MIQKLRRPTKTKRNKETGRIQTTRLLPPSQTRRTSLVNPRNLGGTGRPGQLQPLSDQQRLQPAERQELAEEKLVETLQQPLQQGGPSLPGLGGQGPPPLQQGGPPLGMGAPLPQPGTQAGLQPRTAEPLTKESSTKVRPVTATQNIEMQNLSAVKKEALQPLTKASSTEVRPQPQPQLQQRKPQDMIEQTFENPFYNNKINNINSAPAPASVQPALAPVQLAPAQSSTIIRKTLRTFRDKVQNRFTRQKKYTFDPTNHSNPLPNNRTQKYSNPLESNTRKTQQRKTQIPVINNTSTKSKGRPATSLKSKLLIPVNLKLNKNINYKSILKLQKNIPFLTLNSEQLEARSAAYPRSASSPSIEQQIAEVEENRIQRESRRPYYSNESQVGGSLSKKHLFHQNIHHNNSKTTNNSKHSKNNKKIKTIKTSKLINKYKKTI